MADGAGPSAPVTPLQTLASAPAVDGQSSFSSAARTSSGRPLLVWRLVPDEPRDPGEERSAKRQCTKIKRRGKHRRRRGIRSAPTDVWAAIFKQLPDLERHLPSLRLVSRQFDDAVCTRVLTTLRPLRTVRDAQLSTLLNKLPILRSLDVSGCDGMTGAWMRDLEQLNTITHLCFDRCPRIFPGRESSYWLYISSADSLQNLSVAENPAFADEDLGVLYELPFLRKLCLVGCSSLTAGGLMIFGQKPEFATSLTALDLDQLVGLEDACLAGLSGLVKLETLSMAHCHMITWEGLGFLAPMPKLKSLSVEGCRSLSLKGAVLGLSQLTSLQSLHLGYLAFLPTDQTLAIEEAYRAARNSSGFGSWSAGIAASFPGLSRLHLGSSRSTDLDLLSLRSLTALTHLDLNDCQELTSDGLSALLSLKQLSVVCLEGCIGVNRDGVAHLAALSELRDLDLGACDDVDDEALEVLEAATKLSCLNLVDCSVSDEGVDALRDLLPQLAISYTSGPGNAWLLLDSEDSDEDGVGAAFHMWLDGEMDGSDNEEEGAAGDAQHRQAQNDQQQQGAEDDRQQQQQTGNRPQQPDEQSQQRSGDERPQQQVEEAQQQNETGTQ